MDLTTALERPESYLEEKKLGRGTLFQYLGSSSTLAAGALFYIFMVKTIPQAAVGSVTLFQSFLGLFATIFALGLSYAGQHFISFHLAKGQKSSAIAIIRTISLMIVILAILTAASIFIFSDIVAPLFFNTTSVEEKEAFLNLARTLFLVGGLFLSNNLMNGMLLGLQRYKQSGMATMSAAIMNYGLPFGLLVVYIMNLPGASYIVNFAVLLNGGFVNVVSIPSAIVITGWMIGYSISASIFIVLLITSIRSVFKEKIERTLPDPSLVKRMFRYSLPVYLSSMVTFGALYVDRLAVGRYLDISQLAIYNLGLLIATSVAFFINPINSILLPKISQYFAQRDQTTIRRGVGMTTDIVAFIYVPIALFIVSISSGIIIVLGKPDYISAALPFSIILTVSAVFITQNVLVQALAGIGATKTFLFSSTSTLASNLILSIILIPRFGLTGAAISYSSVYVVNFAVIYTFAKRFGISEHRISRIAKIWVSALVMFLAVHVFDNYVFTLSFNVPPGAVSFLVHDVLRLVVYALVGLAVYMGMIRATRSINRREIEFFFRFVPGWLQFTKGFLIRLFSSRKDLMGNGKA